MSSPTQGHVLFVCDRAVTDPAVATVSGQLGQALVRVHSADEALAQAGATDFALMLVG